MPIANVDRLDIIPGLRYEIYTREGTKFEDIGNARAVANSATSVQTSVAYVQARYGRVSQFAGYEVTQTTNLDNPVHLTGAEFSYRQVMAFLRAPSRGLSLALNYTVLKPDDWHNFVSSTSGALKRHFDSTSISYRYKRFSMQVNSTAVFGDKIGETLRNGVVDRQNYRPRRIIHDVNLSLALWRNLQAYVFARNITNGPDENYTVVADLVFRGSSSHYGTYWSFGVKGRY